MDGKNGGPAFPTGDGMTPYNPGMTLRDYFAIHASVEDIDEMLYRVPKVERVIGEGGRKHIISGLPDNARQIARYMYADAMLKAREVKHE